MDDLPIHYDAIVVGTGMVESVIAAALSRIGKSVLHLDSNEYYGENWASFNLKGFEDWITNSTDYLIPKTSNESFKNLIAENEEVIQMHRCPYMRNIYLNNIMCHVERESSKIVKEKALEETIVENSIVKSPKSVDEDIYKLNRRFNLDVCPKLLFSKGLLVQLLITSNIAKYAEFKSVSRVLTWRKGQLEPVPCSRSDVFATKNVTVVHKRILVKILTLFANYSENWEEFKGFENRTFLEYLKHKKLPEKLIHYILYAIAMGDNTTTCLDGVRKCKAFLESLGRYGNTPFIFPMYGSGELPQCFCRLCAVFGGVYCLQRGAEALIIKNNECLGIVSNNKRLSAKTVILSAKYAPNDYLSSANFKWMSRGIFITDRSILKDDKESLTLLQFPPIPEISDKCVTVLELGSGTYTCPENYFVVHMTTETIDTPYSDLKHVIEELFDTKNNDDSRPKILWSGIWSVLNIIPKTNDSCIKNVKICRTSDSELDYDCSINEAKRIFKELYPEEEFLPRAPDPDEIVLDVEETQGDGVELSEKELRIPEASSRSMEHPSKKESVPKSSDFNAEEQSISDVRKKMEEIQTSDLSGSKEGEIQSVDS